MCRTWFYMPIPSCRRPKRDSFADWHAGCSPCPRRFALLRLDLTLTGLCALALSAGWPDGRAAEVSLLTTNTVFGNLVAISDDGSTVVGTLYGVSNHPPAYWTREEGVVVIGTGSAHNCSADGSVIVGTMSGDGFRDVWGTSTPFPAPPVSNLAFSGAYDITPDGSVIVGNYGYRSGLDDIVCAYRWEETTGYQTLVSVTNGAWCNATGVDGTGEIVCGFSGDTAYRWTSGEGYQAWPSLGGQMMPWYMSTDGQHIVGSFGTNGKGLFRWDPLRGAVVLMEDYSDYADTVLSLSPDGAVAAAAGPTGADRSLVWDEYNVVRLVRDVLVLEHYLPFKDWTELTIQGVSSNRHVVVGFGRDSSGDVHTWVAQLDHPLGSTRMRINSGSEIGLSWLGTTGETYTVEWRDAGSHPAPWGTLDALPGQEGLMTVNDGSSGTPAGKHYRLVRSPVP